MFNPQKTRIIFWGTPEFAVPSFFELLQKKYEIVSVVTQPDKPVGRKQELTASPVKKAALKYNVLVLQPEDVKNANFIKRIKNLDPDLCVVAAYGNIIPKNILDIPEYGFINVHTSLLPKLRGASPMQTAILEDHPKTGVTIMQMDEKMDTGPILMQKEVILTNKDNLESLHDNLKILGANLLVEAIPPYMLGNLKPAIQDDSEATYSELISKDTGKIDLENDLPEEIERKIRALSPWPGVWTIYKNKRLKILAVHLDENKLILDQVQPEGKKPMTWAEFIRGY